MKSCRSLTILSIALAVSQVAAFEEPGLCGAARYTQSTYTLPAIAPAKSAVSKAMPAACVVRVYVRSLDGSLVSSPRYLSGVLIHSKLVATSMHSFAPGSMTGDVDAQGSPNKRPVDVADVKVLFNYTSGALPATNDARWLPVKTIDPLPTIDMQKNLQPSRDFVVLELTTAQSSSKVAPCFVPYVSGRAPATPFILHHSGDPSSGLPMPLHVSYDKSRQSPFVESNLFGSASLAFGGKIQSWGGGSGGGVFWGDRNGTSSDNGKLLFLQSTADPLVYSATDVPKVSGVCNITSIFNSVYPSSLAKSLLPQYVVPLTDAQKGYLNILLRGTRGSQGYSGYMVGQDDLSACSYKWVSEHISRGAIWFNYGKTSQGTADQSVSFPLKSLMVNGKPPAGAYRLRISLMGSIMACSFNGSSTDLPYTGTAGMYGCPTNNDLSLRDDRGEIATISIRKGNQWRELRRVTGGDLVDGTSFPSSDCSVGSNYKLAFSDVVEFTLDDNTNHDLYFSENELATDGEVEIKIQSKLRYGGGYGYDYVKGLSIHDISLEYVETDGDAVPWYLDNCPGINNPNQEDSDGDGVGDACEAGTQPPAPIPTFDPCRTVSVDGCRSDYPANMVVYMFGIDVRNGIAWYENPRSAKYYYQGTYYWKRESVFWEYYRGMYQYPQTGAYTVKIYLACAVPDADGIWDARLDAPLTYIEIKHPFMTCDIASVGKPEMKRIAPSGSVIPRGLLVSSTETTQAEYFRVTGKNPSVFVASSNPADWRRPVENVTFYDAVLFCNEKSLKEGFSPVYTISGAQQFSSAGACTWLESISANNSRNGYRLPSPSEWEYAYKAGKTTDYYWGTSFNGDYAWCSDNATTTKPVQTKLPNDWGLYDMAGNVEEWTWPSSGNPELEGGGYTLSSSTNYFKWNGGHTTQPMYKRDTYIGFRVVRKAPDITPILNLLLD